MSNPERRARPLVICVDDEAPVLSALRRTFRNEPYEVLTTEHPKEALEWMEDEEVTVLITDQRMAEMPGTELVHAARRRRPAAACMILTGYPESVPGESLARPDGPYLMPKPWIDEDLRRTVRRLLQNSVSARERSELLRLRPPRARRVHAGLADLAELVVRLDCQGRLAAEAAEPATALLQRHETAKNGLVVVVEDLGGLLDGPEELVERIARAADAWEVRTLVLDRSGEAARLLARRESGSLAAIPPERETRSVLFVSRNAESRATIESLLQAAGHSCSSVPSGAEAIHALEDGGIDVVLLDLSLPGTEAGEVARRARNALTLGISTWGELWDGETRSRLGIRRILQKPIPVTELLAAVRGAEAPRKGDEEETAV